jgi:hypothetical protein
MTHRLPPFGRELAAGRTLGKPGRPPLLVVVFAGADAWTRAKAAHRRLVDVAPLVLPDGEPPGRFAWPVHEQVVVIEAEGLGDLRILELVRALLLAGAAVVAVVTPDPLGPVWLYEPDGSAWGEHSVVERLVLRELLYAEVQA